MEVQPMTVIVNTDYGFPGECGSKTWEVKKPTTPLPPPTKIPKTLQ